MAAMTAGTVAMAVVVAETKNKMQNVARVPVIEERLGDAIALAPLDLWPPPPHYGFAPVFPQHLPQRRFGDWDNLRDMFDNDQPIARIIVEIIAEIIQNDRRARAECPVADFRGEAVAQD